MSATNLETLKEIFHSARELPPNERSAFLDRACGNDEQLRHEVEALLQSHQAADGFISEPPALLAAQAIGRAEELSDVGKTVGRYKLIERIGSGGMGAVYLAQRADQQFEMQVAVKLIKRGMDSELVLRRFREERQILASLEHPNIARLLDGGTTDDGLPYFVMEYIKGERIDRYADERRLSIKERLELFRQVCGAVSYAHQRLIVHRDLKPSNILVTPEGVPKLLDFGIARIIHADDGAETIGTLTAMPMMTPEYASPEQIEGAHATTLSDVYSLGAVLYALLSGRPPHRFQSRSRREISAAASAAVEKPSTAITRVEQANGSPASVPSPEQISEAREGTVEKLQRRLRGDLDNIVLMAMRQETARRYRSVEQLSEDIRRHLMGRPVIARPDTFSYRAAKFVRRNRIGLSAAALLFLTLVGGIVATTLQARKARTQEQRALAQQARAERRFNDVRKLANSVLYDYHDAIRALPGSTKVREQLVNGAVTYLDSLAAEAHDDPALQQELAAAYERVGDVRGGQRGSNLGDLPGAVDSYTKALRLREALVALKPDDVQVRRDLARAHNDLGTTLAVTDDLTRGIEHLKKARILVLELTREQPSDEALQSDLISALVPLGDALLRAGDVNDALDHFRAAVSATEEIARSKPADQRLRSTQLMVQIRLTEALWRQQEDEAAAWAANDKAVALVEALIAAEPLDTDWQRARVAVYGTGGQMRRDNDPAAAFDDYRRAAEVLEQLLKGDPANLKAEGSLTEVYIEMAHLLSRLGDTRQALVYYTKAAEHSGKVSADAAHAGLGARLKGMTGGAGAAAMRARLGETEFALAECSRLATQLGEIPGDPTNLHRQLYKAEVYRYLGQAYREIAAAKGSESEARQYITLARDMFRHSMNLFDDARNRGRRFDPTEVVDAESVASELAKCETALAR